MGFFVAPWGTEPSAVVVRFLSLWCNKNVVISDRVNFQSWQVVDCRGFIHSWSTMYLLDLPPELLIPVLAVATAIHPIPAHVLVLSKFIYSIAAPILYRHPFFSSISALALFPPVIWGSDTVGRPSTITVDLAGADVGRGAFRGLWRLLSKTQFPRDVTNLTTRLELEDLRLRLHSTSDGDADDQSLQALDFVE